MQKGHALAVSSCCKASRSREPGAQAISAVGVFEYSYAGNQTDRLILTDITGGSGNVRAEWLYLCHRTSTSCFSTRASVL
jgi:hypothetical protein